MEEKNMQQLSLGFLFFFSFFFKYTYTPKALGRSKGREQVFSLSERTVFESYLIQFNVKYIMFYIV